MRLPLGRLENKTFLRKKNILWKKFTLQNRFKKSFRTTGWCKTPRNGHYCLLQGRANSISKKSGVCRHFIRSTSNKTTLKGWNVRMIKEKQIYWTKTTTKKRFVFISKDGRPYKAYLKPNLLKCRFNRCNVNILTTKGLSLRLKCLNSKQISFYPITNGKVSRSLCTSIRKIRYANVFTKRGLLLRDKIFLKKSGRISGYT